MMKSTAGGWGTTAAGQAFNAEEGRQTRRYVVPGSEDLAATPVDTVDDLTHDNGDGSSRMTFIFGLHDPFDANTPRWFPGG